MKKLSLCWMVTLWICSIFSVKAQTTIYEHGAEITSIDQIKDGALFVMKKGSEYLCFPKVQNASLKDLSSASSSKAFIVPLNDKGEPTYWLTLSSCHTNLCDHCFLYPHLGHTPFSSRAMPQRGQRSMTLRVSYSCDAAFTPLVNVSLAMLSLSLRRS